ncbi:synaptotagmin-like protein 4 [Oncorhynchus mykiss]|uniref:Synaptotagmin-like protein 4 n=1 Tax=Oncorhynchus mykiss TaxID=8022 RepID=A0A060WSD6_ONCMY|nr:synaptotagmin-like protein 4 [Oncorhynchus mykiss]XP_036798768.1 synaptotagmin-like protein 4 [Oncorhynchus mykiss]XP_036798769.1 synaptotagmin-like protein 4 [Oncorhynchus mykiss]XP_036798770.1 synaptotagmin-like protein 4 [Oncorhynchus mykiss]XP_036798771.1 synaptotagmin-like protein 4 [Oncorhynchus mykiss]XP_036798772.1 synaptotagmin-like protein 4 [Oncorhynchus mykiss]XP_036798773.1 synaptotagmin-like protein 4 [Oncorhynchus mykiss]XP_036798774.1 synaptotagmin-like protein 4 [Oncorhyn
MPQAADMINVAFLTDSERELILEVLRRDEELRQAEEHRVRKLKTELLDIMRKGAKRSSGKYSERSCGRCQEPLGPLSAGSSQCRACKHQVCHNCCSVCPNGSWVCSVCAKEADLKKVTGDWFYDQRVNRFFTTPGHDIVRTSLKKRPPLRKRENMEALLLNSTELNPSQPTTPVPRPRLRDLAASNKDLLDEVSEESVGVKAKEQQEQQQHRDNEPAEKASLNSVMTETESSLGTPLLPRKEESTGQSSPTGSSMNGLVKADLVSSHSPTSDADTSSVVGRRSVSSGTGSVALEDGGLFKKSIRRVQKPSEFTSVLDLREEGAEASEGFMGDRSKSVPGLNVPDDEEDEDIDNLVSIHRKVCSSTSNLRGSKSTLGSLMSIYSEAGDYDSVEVSGDIVFSISYDDTTQSLAVLVKECHSLAHGDARRQRSNPYVKCYLLPDKSRIGKKKTTIKHNTVDPTYNETLKFSISRSQVLNRSLQLSVWHHARLGRNAFLGEVEVPLDCRNLDAGHEECVAFVGKASPLQSSAFSQYKGELLISLKYVSTKNSPTEKTKGKRLSLGKKTKTEQGGELHVLIKEAKNLTAMKAGDTSDSFVKGYLLPSKAKSTKRKTPVVKKTLNPHYDHTFVYKDLTLDQLSEMWLELTVWDREAMSSNDFLGGVRLSTGTATLKVGKEEVEADSTGEEVTLWQKMMQYPDSCAEGTLPLRSSMGKSK